MKDAHHRTVFSSKGETTGNDNNKDVNDDDDHCMFNDNFSASSALDTTKESLDMLPAQQSSAASNRQDNTQEDDNENGSTGKELETETAMESCEALRAPETPTTS